jgi:hypothetical protein
MEGSMTQAQLMTLLDQLRQGLVQTNLSGPTLTGLLGPTVSSSTAAAPPPDEPAAPPPPAPDAPAAPPVVSTVAPEAQSLAQEQSWSGFTTPLAPQTVTVAVKKEAIWERLWNRLSSEPVPVVDFSQHLVLAIIAGREEAGDRIEIEDSKADGDTLTVRYRIIAYARPFAAGGDLKAAPKKSTQYLLTVVPRTVTKVTFERLKGD